MSSFLAQPPYITIIVVFILCIIIFSTSVDYPCSKVNSVDTSISVITTNRVVIGLNTDTDSLKFGKVSAGASVKRSIEVNYKKNANECDRKK